MRTFVAMELGSETARAVADAGHRLSAIVEPWGWKVAWVAPEKIHLTLKFLGNVAPDRAPAIAAALVGSGAAHAPVDVAVRGVGTFPERGVPRVVWVGLEDEAGALAAIVRDLEERLAAIDFAREDRPFHAHVTLGRVKAPGNVRFSDAFASLAGADCGRARLDCLTFFRSDLKTGTYHVLDRIPLRGETR